MTSYKQHTLTGCYLSTTHILSLKVQKKSLFLKSRQLERTFIKFMSTASLVFGVSLYVSQLIVPVLLSNLIISSVHDQKYSKSIEPTNNYISLMISSLTVLTLGLSDGFCIKHFFHRGMSGVYFSSMSEVRLMPLRVESVMWNMSTPSKGLQSVIISYITIPKLHTRAGVSTNDMQ
jgi:hypothetical protein